MNLTESTVEDAALAWFADAGYAYLQGSQIAPGEPAAERSSFGDVILAGRLREALYRLNPQIPELLEKLLKDELKVISRRNVVQSQLFSEKLKKTINAYHNRAITTMEVIEELIALAKEMDAAAKRGESLGLTEDEIAFYDALAANESAVKVMGDAQLKVIATELITKVRESVTIDWTLREGARAKIRVMVKRILNKYGYPPDLQEEAVKTVLKQAEVLCAEWA